MTANSAQINQAAKILLIQPPYSIWPGESKIAQPPLGLAYIAAVMENEGYTIKIIDSPLEGYEQEVKLQDGRYRYGLNIDQIMEKVKGFSPEIVGISCSFSTLFDTVCEISRAIKEYNSNIKICVGGAHPTAVPGEMVEKKEFDFVIIGEGEIRFKKLVRVLPEGGDFSKIDGLCYKINGKSRLNPATDYIQNMDEIPFPARHLLNMEKYFEIHRPQGVSTKSNRGTTLITSRGCPANCVFCSIHGIWGKKFRAHSPEYVVSEIEHLIERYSIKELVFEDDNLTFDIERAEKIFDLMIEKGLNLQWKTPNGIALWRLTENLIIKMRKSGCYQTSFAIESGNEHVLHSIIKKPLDLTKVKNFVNITKSQGILTYGFFVVGFPGETFEQMEDSFKYALNIGLDKAIFVIATPYPGTKLYDICLEKGYLVHNYSYKNLITRKANIKTPEFTPKQLERFVARSIFKYQLKKFLRNPLTTLNIVYSRFKSEPRTMWNWLLSRIRESFRSS